MHNLMKSSHPNLILMLLIILSSGFYNVFWAEKIQWSNGLGADGLQYGAMVKYLAKGVSRISSETMQGATHEGDTRSPDNAGKTSGSALQKIWGIASGKLESYYLQRILPSTVVYAGLSLFGLPPDDSHIIRGFEVLNSALLLVAAFLWILISRELNLSARGEWLGFAGLFLNFFNLKFNIYYPVLTDVAAFTLGISMFYFFLKRKSLPLLSVGIIGFFTWPTAL